MKKILFLIRSLHRGGAERQLVVLAQGLKQRGHTVKVIVFYPGGPLEAELAAAAIPVLTLAKQSRWDLVAPLWRLVQLLRREQPDVLHGYLGAANILATLAKPLAPPLRLGWGVRTAYLDRAGYGRAEQLSFRAECGLSRYADFIIANSHAGHDHAVAHGFPAARTHVVPNGIDTAHFCPQPEAGQALRALWGVRDGERLVGLVGRLDFMKNHPLFLHAAAHLAPTQDAVRFVCVGDGPPEYRARLQALAAELGIGAKVIWAGGHTAMPAVYSALDLACSTSRGEGFSNVIGEAMACGTPCVVTAVGDSARIVDRTGLAVTSDDARALSHGLAELLSRPLAEYQQLRAAARCRIEQTFSIRQLLDSTERILWDQV